MDKNLKLMKPHSDDTACTYENKCTHTESKKNFSKEAYCNYNYFGHNSGINYDDSERYTFWEY